MCAGYFNDRQTGEAILVTRPARLETKTYICWVGLSDVYSANMKQHGHLGIYVGTFYWYGRVVRTKLDAGFQGMFFSVTYGNVLANCGWISN